jgi:uncharacterized protein (DUF58 family)
MTATAVADLSRVPVAVEARARPLGWLPFGFGRRFFVGLLIGLVWLVPAWWSPRFTAAMFLWDLLLLVAWYWDFSRLPAPREIFVRRVWHTRPALGVASRIDLHISSDGQRVLQVLALDGVPVSLSAEPPALVATLPSGGSALVSYAILPRQRGESRVGCVFLRYESALHLAERRAKAETSQTVRVLPNIEQAQKQALSLVRSRQIEMEKRHQRRRGMGHELDGLREYQQGDDLRDVCWTATARRHHPITKVFRMERSQTVWLVLDAGRLMRAQVQEPGSLLLLSKLDHAVNAALSLAQVAMQCGDRAGLLAYGSRPQRSLMPASGSEQARRFADALAEVQAERTEPDHGRAVRALLGWQKRRSLVVWITDFAETATVPEVIEYAMQMTPRHLVIFAAIRQPELGVLAEATPASPEEMYRHAAALEISQRRESLLRRLRQRGVQAFEWMPWALSSVLVNRYLEIKERNSL